MPGLRLSLRALAHYGPLSWNPALPLHAKGQAIASERIKDHMEPREAIAAELFLDQPVPS